MDKIKRIGIVGASDCIQDLALDMDYVAIDGGLATIVKHGIEPVAIIGDFDSLENKKLLEGHEAKVLPHIKDDTDTAKGVEYAIQNGYNKIYLYGVTGGRLDHFFAVMCLLYKYRTLDLTIIDQQNKIYLLTEGTYSIQKDHYQYLSFFAVTTTQLSIEGCFYPLDQYNLSKDDPLCVSNEILDKEAMITTTNDLVVVQSKNK